MENDPLERLPAAAGSRAGGSAGLRAAKRFLDRPAAGDQLLTGGELLRIRDWPWCGNGRRIGDPMDHAGQAG